MTKKTTKPKVAKKAVKKQAKVSKSAVMIAILAAVVVFGVLTALIVKEKRDFAVKQDRARFTEVERRLENLREKLSANGEEWKIEKSCDKPNAKFYMGEAGTCLLSVGFEGSSSASLDVLESYTTEILGATTKDRGYSEYDEGYYVGLKGLGISGIGCSIYYKSPTSQSKLDHPRVSCGGDALKMYFPEAQ